MLCRALLGFALISGPVAAQDRRPSHCIGIADAAPELEFIQKASYTDPVPEFSVRLHYMVCQEHWLKSIQVTLILNN